jgi:hypothetical protein
MAVVRLSVVLVGALAIAVLGACRASEAGPGSGLTAPAGWKTLPSLQAAAHDAAKAGGFTVNATEAWGETARGCYGAWLSLATTAAGPAKLADELVQGIQNEPALAGIAITDVVKPAANTETDVLSLAFDRAPYRGKLRARLANDGHVTALVCFWNDREPAACAAACEPLLGGVK